MHNIIYVLDQDQNMRRNKTYGHIYSKLVSIRNKGLFYYA